MWDQKKANAPQQQQQQQQQQSVYPQLYGQQSGQQMPQQMPQQFQSVPHYPHSMSASMGQQMASGMAQGLGPPPPYSPYPEVSQQQMKYMQQLTYSQNQYMAATGQSQLPGVATHQGVPQTSQQSHLGGPHSYHNPYQSSPYHNPSLYHNPYNPYQNLPPNSTVVMPHAFDAGARFDGIARPGVPPPPPGVAPNAAQMAALQGHNVVIGQKKSSFLEGGSSGGYTFW